MRRTLIRLGTCGLILAAMAGAAAAIAMASSHFLATVYPPPVPSRPGAAFSACPSPSGLERFDAATIKLAKQRALRYGHVSLTTDLIHSDRSFWPMLRRFWRGVKHGVWLGGLQAVREAQIGGPKMVWSVVVGNDCGAKLVADSLNLVVTVRHLQRCADCNGVNELFIDRRGVPLVYMVH